MIGSALCLPPQLLAQSPPQPPAQPAPAPPEPAEEPIPVHGTVLFQSKPGQGTEPAAAQPPAADPASAPAHEAAISPGVTDAEREAATITAYDLDVHLIPAHAGLAARVRMTFRNDGPTPLSRLVLQISSTLHWESVSGPSGTGLVPLLVVEHQVATDADHTGFVSEAVIPLPAPLAPGASYDLAAVYSGSIPHSSGRLDRIGVPADQAEFAEWDAIGKETTSLRGFGEVLWYPVAAAPVYLGDGAKFFAAVGRARSQARHTTIHLRLAVEYIGEAPHSAYFCGRLERLTAVSENQDVPVAESPGIATAEFAAQPLGFRAPSLFLTDRPEVVSEDGLLSIVSENSGANYETAAQQVQPLLSDWFAAAGPAEPLHILDHAGQTFQDAALLVGPMGDQPPADLDPALAEALTHAWVRSSEPWIEDGLAQWMVLLWLERTSGRDAAVRELQREAVPLAMAEPSPAASAPAASPSPGQSLLQPRDDVYFRTKAAAVWWMLRSIVGDPALKQALQSFVRESREPHNPNLVSTSEDDTTRLQRTLERRTGASLAWFFDDWVRADKGLPDLSIVQVTPRELPTKGGKSTGWLVAVEVRNDGDAVAEVPVTVQSGTLAASERLRIAGHSSASTRILFEKTPELVTVNDGTVPEQRTSTHTRQLTIEPH
jgi:hypothetical protein